MKKIKLFIQKNKSNLLFIGVLVLLLLPQTRMPIQVFIQRMVSFSPSEVDAEESEVLQDYTWQLEQLEGGTKYFSESKKKVVLINFWATWCPPCIAEMPSLQKLYDAYGNKVDFYFVTSEEKEVVQRFMDKKEYTFPVYIQTSKAPRLLTSSSLPTTYVIAKDGEIRVNKVGVADWDSKKTREILDRLLEESI